MGRFGGSASCVAVGSQYVVTTSHQSCSANTKIHIAGGSYSIEQVKNHPDADLRVVKLKDAELDDFVSVYSGNAETGAQIVLGGFGAGIDLEKSGRFNNGYAWDNAGNANLRWATNTVDGKIQNVRSGGKVSSIITADFDAMGRVDATVAEGAIARHDSGGGWFIKKDGKWQLAGLSRCVKRVGESLYVDDTHNGTYTGYFDAVRISDYAGWISGITGHITARDITSTYGLSTVPEPCTLLRLGFGLAAMRKRA